MNVKYPISSILLAGVVAGCATFPFGSGGEQRAGAIDVEACEAYLERHPFGHKSDLKRLQLAMAYLTVKSHHHDPARARTLLWQLAGREPGHFRTSAARTLELLTEVERLRGETTSQKQRIDRLTSDAARLRGAMEGTENRLAEQGEVARRLQVELQSERAKLRLLGEERDAQKREIERLTRELSELKRIDARQAP